MAKKPKYYVVWDGHNPGIYDNWKACQQQVKNYPNAKYKSYPSRAAAEQAYHSGPDTAIKKPGKQRPTSIILPEELPIDWSSISVDAACSGNPGVLEYRGVLTKDGTEIFRMGPFKDGTNNVGEFLALVHALAMLKKQGDTATMIYSDSRIAIGWVKRKKAKTTLKKSAMNARWIGLISRAEQWLKANSYATKIEKWNTKEWGEIPADFGRK